MSATVKKYWYGSKPTECEVCKHAIKDTFLDARLRIEMAGSVWHGWGKVCEACHAAYGCGTGIGKGQKYQKQKDGTWLKIEG